ncbi:hypothetical protein BB561_002629 [Smittium simulii]|uniref:ATP-dependent RNA helicase n=1 Tax=Smittium simulii TaxID=133385 RepID=A0A2T9YPV1_9FUNG|nr:hypothetical protein BB561_002629 [Smittium simulii]
MAKVETKIKDSDKTVSSNSLSDKAHKKVGEKNDKKAIKTKRKKSKLDNIKKYLSKIKAENAEVYEKVIGKLSEDTNGLLDLDISEHKLDLNPLDKTTDPDVPMTSTRNSSDVSISENAEALTSDKLDYKRSSGNKSSSDSDISSDEESSDENIVDYNQKSQTKETKGIKRFPDFSAEYQETQIVHEEADLMGIPEWIRTPKVIDSSESISILDERFNLSPQTIENCKKEGIESLFSVQVASLPLLKSNYVSLKYSMNVRDLCISAPTGSGKTLAYVIPIIEKLIPRVIRRLRALVVLPTRELASQVKKVFDNFTRGTSLKVGLASGEYSFQKEQLSLVHDTISSSYDESSKVDILVCTPGRLIDHILQTANFSLDSLETLVMDEADRLLSQGYNDWLSKLYNFIDVSISDEVNMNATNEHT